MNKPELESFMDSLYEIGCIKFGEFFLSSGLKTPVYFDLRLIVSYPKILQQASRLINQIIEKNNIKFDVICGVPYGALAVATVLSIQIEKPMIFKRKNTKDYGVKMIEGLFKQGDSCLIIEDTVVYATSILETVEALNYHGLIVTDAITILDREQGGSENIAHNDLKLHSIMKASDLLEHLVERGKLTMDKADEIVEFLRDHSFKMNDFS